MHTTEFSSTALGRLVRWRDKRKFPCLNTRHNKQEYLSQVANQVAGNSFTFGNFTQSRVGTFSVFQPKFLGDTLILRKLDYLLRSRYSTRQSDRNSLVSQIEVLLQENCPKYIYKLDISKFYESIDRSALLKRIAYDGKLSSTATNLLARLFEHFSKYSRYGLPRGLAISATLSEIYLDALDKKIPRLPGVYYYARYVDDLLIFAHRPLQSLQGEVVSVLPRHMKLNAEKCKDYYVGCSCYPICTCGGQCKCIKNCVCPVAPQFEISYLGYSLVLDRRPPKNGWAEVKVRFAPSKIRRIKTRIVRALIHHLHSPNPDLLYQRVRFLTENHRLRQPGRRGKLSAGIYFNYPLVNDKHSLVDLNAFLRSQVYSSKNSYGTKVATSLTAQQKARIAKLSFVSGFDSRRTRALKASEFRTIRACWR
jgi:hypothetical protein